jgi:hypothetical protein
MCFTETQSYINSVALIASGSYVINSDFKPALVAFFFSIKELLQGLLYRFQGNKEMLKNLAMLSYIHLCSQPFMMNVLFMHFAPSKSMFWNIILTLTFIFALYAVTTLDELDIQDDPNCKSDNNKQDFCAKETTAYIGKYHVGYKFNTDKQQSYANVWYWWWALFFIPALFTKSKYLSLLVLGGGVSVFLVYDYLLNIYPLVLNLTNTGEKGAMWCFLSIALIPIVLFGKSVKKYLVK